MVSPGTAARLDVGADGVLMRHPDAAEGPAAWRERRAPDRTLMVSELPE